MKRILDQLEQWRRALVMSALTPFLRRKRKHIDQLDPTVVQRVLIVRDDGLGDAITTLPMLRLLHRLLPHARIDVLCTHRNAAVFAAMREVSVIWVRRSPLHHWRWLRKRLRSVSYDLVLLTVRSQTSWRALFLNSIAGPRTVLAASWRGERYRLYFDFHSHYAAAGANEWEQTLFLAAEIFGYTPSEEDLQPFFPVVPPSWLCAERKLQQLGINGEFIALNLSAYQPRNRWHPQQVQRVVQLLGRNTGLPLLLLSTQQDYYLAQQLAQQHSVLLYPPTADIHEVAGVLARARCVVTPDTGIVHLAVALQTPLVALYSANGKAEHYWGPYRHRHAIALHSAIGAPLSTIDPERVVEAVVQLLKQSVMTSSPAPTTSSHA